MPGFSTCGGSFIFNTTVEEIGSGACAGNSTVTPAGPVCTFCALASVNNRAESILFFKLGINNVPSFGQSNTCRYNVVPLDVTFFVQRPHASFLKGLAVV